MKQLKGSDKKIYINIQDYSTLQWETFRASVIWFMIWVSVWAIIAIIQLNI